MVVEQMITEATQKTPLETGGVLAGYFSDNDKETVVTDILGPGPKAKHRKTTYCPDYSFHREEIGKIYDESEGRISYLGDWHTHPNGLAYLSWTDKSALRNIARHRNNFIDAPIMLIWGAIDRLEEQGWNPSAWRIRSLKGVRVFQRWKYVPLKIKRFE